MLIMINTEVTAWQKWIEWARRDKAGTGNDSLAVRQVHWPLMLRSCVLLYRNLSERKNPCGSDDEASGIVIQDDRALFKNIEASLIVFCFNAIIVFFQSYI